MPEPKYLYKFRSFRDQSHKRILTAGEIFFPSPDKFNDPFDCSVPIHYENYTKSEFLRYWIERVSQEHPELRSHDIRESVKNFYKNSRTPQGKEILVETQDKVIREIRSEKIGVFSLTANLSEILSWSHYADSHRGFCVGFNTLSLRAFLDTCGETFDLRPVDYVEQYPIINAYRTSDVEKTNQLVWTKSKDWEYEGEYRILWWGGPNKLLKIPKGIIRRVILGCQMSLANKNEIMSILRSVGDRISLFQARPKRDSFGLRFEFIGNTTSDIEHVTS